MALEANADNLSPRSPPIGSGDECRIHVSLLIESNAIDVKVFKGIKKVVAYVLGEARLFEHVTAFFGRALSFNCLI